MGSLLWGLSLFRVNFSTAVKTANSFYETRPVQNVFMAHFIPFYPILSLWIEHWGSKYSCLDYAIVTFSQNNNYLKIILLPFTNLHLSHPGTHWSFSFFDFIFLTFWPLQRKRISSLGFFYQGHLYFELVKLIIVHIIFDIFGWFSLWESLISELTVATEVLSKFLCNIFKQQKHKKGCCSWLRT